MVAGRCLGHLLVMKHHHVSKGQFFPSTFICKSKRTSSANLNLKIFQDNEEMDSMIFQSPIGPENMVNRQHGQLPFQSSEACNSKTHKKFDVYPLFKVVTNQQGWEIFEANEVWAFCNHLSRRLVTANGG